MKKLDGLILSSETSKQAPVKTNAPDLPSLSPPPKCTAPVIIPEKPYCCIKEKFMGETELTEIKNFVETDTYEPRGTSNRETSYYGQYSYKYGKTYHPARKIPTAFQNLGDMIDKQFPNYQGCPKTYLASKYNNGKAYCPSHSDDEPTLSPTADIFTFSMFASRSMEFESIHSDEVDKVILNDNSLLVFSRSSQCYWKHSIPVDESVEDPRYSVTVRILEPYNVNSTRLYGDSNTAFIKFGVGPKTLGRWCPGERIKTPRVGDLPSPSDVPPVRNMIIHTGINDLRDRYNPLSPSQLVRTMEDKCAAIHRIHPQMRIIISPVLPTRDRQLNNLVRETNAYIYMLSNKHYNIIMSDNNVFADDEGLLLNSLGSRKVNDIVHINLSGIIKLGMILKSHILPYRMRNSHSTGNRSPVKANVPQSTKDSDVERTHSAASGGDSPRNGIQGDGTSFSTGGTVPPRS